VFTIIRLGWLGVWRLLINQSFGHRRPSIPLIEKEMFFLQNLFYAGVDWKAQVQAKNLFVDVLSAKKSKNHICLEATESAA
jgi:hypothetical protein